LIIINTLLISNFLRLQEAKSLTDAEATERETLNLALQASRNDIASWGDDDLQHCLVASLSEAASKGYLGDMLNHNEYKMNDLSYERHEGESKDFKSYKEDQKLTHDDELISLQGDMIRSIAAQSEREYLEKAIADSIIVAQKNDWDSKNTESEILERIKAESLASVNKINDDAIASANEEIKLALELSHMDADEVLALAIKQSINSSLSPKLQPDDNSYPENPESNIPESDSAYNPELYYDDDEDIRKAIEASLSDSRF
jgi:hypothetical protein